MYSTDELMNDCWMRNLGFYEFVAQAMRLDIALCTEQEYIAYCIQMDAEMSEAFEAMGV